jgi:hypothetical protein
VRPHFGALLAVAALAAPSGAAAESALAADPGGAELSVCALHAATTPEELAPGDPLLFEIRATCEGGGPLRGVDLDLVLEGAAGELPLASLVDATLGDTPAILAPEGRSAEPGCYRVRARFGAEQTSLRLCAEPLALELPAVDLPPPRAVAPGAEPLERCRFLRLQATPRASFAPGEALDIEAVLVCREAVPRVVVTLERDAGREGWVKLEQTEPLPLLKGTRRLTFSGSGYRAAGDCLRVVAARGHSRIEARSCIRPARLRFASEPVASELSRAEAGTR